MSEGGSAGGGWGITKDEYDKKLKELKEKQRDILLQIEDYTNADESFYLTANKVLSLAQRAYDIFKSSEINEKRQLLNFLLQNCLLNGENLEFALKTPFDTIAKYAKCPTWLPLLDAFGTLDWSSIKRELALFTPVSPFFFQNA